MRWKKTDLKKRANIIKEKIKNIDATNDEIAKKTKTSASVVSRVLNGELVEVGWKSDYIAKIIDSDRQIIELANSIVLEHLQFLACKENDTYSVKSVSDIAEKSFKRYILLKWNVTDSDWGLKSIEDFRKLSDDDLLKFL